MLIQIHVATHEPCNNAEGKSTLPPIAKGKGRVFVYRPGSFGLACKPTLNIDGKEAGTLYAQGFFYSDQTPGNPPQPLVLAAILAAAGSRLVAAILAKDLIANGSRRLASAAVAGGGGLMVQLGAHPRQLPPDSGAVNHPERLTSFPRWQDWWACTKRPAKSN